MALDAVLATQEPVHGPVKLVVAGVLDAEFLAQRMGQGLAAQGAGGGQLGAGIQDAGQDDRGGEGPLAGGAAVEEPLEAQASGGSEGGGDMAVGPGAQDGEGVAHGGERNAAFQKDAQSLDDVLGPRGQVGEGALFDFAVFAEGLAQQDGGRGVTVGYPFDVHGYDSNWRMFSYKGYKQPITWVHKTVQKSRQLSSCQ